MPCWNNRVALLPTILTEWTISSGCVITIVVFAGKLIVSYSGLVESKSLRSSASVVGAIGGDWIDRIGPRCKFQFAPLNGSDVHVRVVRQ